MCAKMVEYIEPETLDCDKPGCGYQEPIAGPLTEDMIGILCPKCGESLLTQQDYNDTMLIIAAMKDYANVINSMSEEEIDELTKNVQLPEGVNKDDLMSLSIKCHKGGTKKEVRIIKK